MIQDRDGEGSTGREGYSHDFQTRVGRRLRQSYRSIVDEPTPDAFAQLLDRLARIGAY